MKTFWTGVVLSSVAFTAAGVAQARGSCIVTCLSATCKVSSIELEKGKNDQAQMKLCRDQHVLEGVVVADFRSKRQNARVSANAQGGKPIELRALLRDYATVDCLATDSADCATGAKSFSPAFLGRQFEPDGTWQPFGDPCSMGLPCGTVRLPEQNWRFRLLDAAQAGQLRIMSTRGQRHEHIATIEAGKAEVPAGWLEPGQSYRYQLMDAERRILAAGEFLTPSARGQRDIDASLAEASRKPEGLREAAFMESLLADGLDWDALQLTLRDAGQP